ncbi:MAG TPA: hypothetical protein VFC74_00260 [Oscillospiraceae bacterium]|nr:hypothetical protein [Oscillospiraceae bacterium]
MALYKESMINKIEDDLAGRNQNWDALDTYLAEKAFKGALLRKGTAQSIPHNTATALTWTDVVYNIGNIYSAGLPTRLTIPSGVNKIIVKASVGFQENTTGKREVYIYKNGNGNYNGRATATVIPVSGTGAIAHVVSPVLEVVAGDYFEIFAMQTSGGSLNVTDWYNIWFAIEAIE